jgi:hypothetical protein
VVVPKWYGGPKGDTFRIFPPDHKRGLEVWVDADFAGGWNPSEADNADNVYYCDGFVIY